MLELPYWIISSYADDRPCAITKITRFFYEQAAHRDPETGAILEGERAFVERVAPEHINPDAASWEVVDSREPGVLPADRTFRDAWKRGAGRVEVDMPKARAIQMARIRKARDARLREMDDETFRLEGLRRLGRVSDADLLAHEQAKQRLRDIPQEIDLEAAQTPEELKALWPADLD